VTFSGSRPHDGSPLVSIVILCHNYGRFLGEAIESALAQTYSNLEILVLDDGSTDESLEVAARYADQVRILSHPNMGLERTCNRGVQEARGEYFTFLSADDIFEPTYVEELAEALRRTPDASFAYCRMRRFGAQTGLMRCFPYSAYILALRTNYVNGSALTRRADYLAVGGLSEELADYALEDWDFWLKLLEEGKRGTYVRTPLLRWRRHEQGSRNPESEVRLAGSLEMIRERHRRLRETVSDAPGRTQYVFDLGVAVLDLALGLSRSARFVRFVERRSWNRFASRHASRLGRASVSGRT
jgi:glycosyltransferase involved in cell wall biosynthesis